MSFHLHRKSSTYSGPVSSPGGPTYDATHEPLYAGDILEASFQRQADVHLFGGKTAAAAAFSRYLDASPSPQATYYMGLGAQRDLMERVSARKWDLPFPGVELGPLPSFAMSPATDPVMAPIGPKSHHAHLIESSRATRARFGR